MVFLVLMNLNVLFSTNKTTYVKTCFLNLVYMTKYESTVMQYMFFESIQT